MFISYSNKLLIIIKFNRVDLVIEYDIAIANF